MRQRNKRQFYFIFWITKKFKITIDDFCKLICVSLRQRSLLFSKFGWESFFSETDCFVARLCGTKRTELSFSWMVHFQVRCSFDAPWTHQRCLARCRPKLYMQRMWQDFEFLICVAEPREDPYGLEAIRVRSVRQVFLTEIFALCPQTGSTYFHVRISWWVMIDNVRFRRTVATGPTYALSVARGSTKALTSNDTCNRISSKWSTQQIIPMPTVLPQQIMLSIPLVEDFQTKNMISIGNELSFYSVFFVDSLCLLGDREHHLQVPVLA